jgi:hypothetical protein
MFLREEWVLKTEKGVQLFFLCISLDLVREASVWGRILNCAHLNPFFCPKISLVASHSFWLCDLALTYFCNRLCSPCSSHTVLQPLTYLLVFLPSGPGPS